MDNFTPRAQQVLQLARREADRFNHGYVGTEHVLLGLIALGHGVAVNALQSLGVDLASVRMEVEKASQHRVRRLRKVLPTRVQKLLRR